MSIKVISVFGKPNVAASQPQTAIPISPDRRKRQRGNAALVEGGLVFVPFFALFLGIVDFGMAIFLRSTFQHAVREGTRFAVTQHLLTGETSHDASVRAVVKDNTMGFINSTNENYIVIKYYNPVTLLETPSNSPGNIVEVSIQGYNWGIIAPLLRSANPIPLNARASDRMESVPDGAAPPPR